MESGVGHAQKTPLKGLRFESITRKTDKGLPQYHDEESSDVFVLSGAEDLVPVLTERDGEWVPPPAETRGDGPTVYRVERYRPRVEGLFARIERWTRVRDRVCNRTESANKLGRRACRRPTIGLTGL